MSNPEAYEVYIEIERYGAPVVPRLRSTLLVSHEYLPQKTKKKVLPVSQHAGYGYDNDHKMVGMRGYRYDSDHQIVGMCERQGCPCRRMLR